MPHEEDTIKEDNWISGESKYEKKEFIRPELNGEYRAVLYRIKDTTVKRGKWDPETRKMLPPFYELPAVMFVFMIDYPGDKRWDSGPVYPWLRLLKSFNKNSNLYKFSLKMDPDNHSDKLFDDEDGTKMSQYLMTLLNRFYLLEIESRGNNPENPFYHITSVKRAPVETIEVKDEGVEAMEDIDDTDDIPF